MKKVLVVMAAICVIFGGIVYVAGQDVKEPILNELKKPLSKTATKTNPESDYTTVTITLDGEGNIIKIVDKSGRVLEPMALAKVPIKEVTHVNSIALIKSAGETGYCYVQGGILRW